MKKHLGFFFALSVGGLYFVWAVFRGKMKVMKRNWWKRKSTKPMKRGKLRRKSKSPQRKLEDEIWQLARIIVFKRDNIENEINCYTCPATGLVGANRQLGHVPWPKATLGAFLKYDLRLLKYQCYRCNINFSGMGGIAYPKMLKENGAEFMEKLEKDRQVSVNAMEHYTKLKAEYSIL